MQKLFQGVSSRLKKLRKRIRRQSRPRPTGPFTEKQRPLLLPQPFPTVENVAAQRPSEFWSSSLTSLPLPTNAAWLNFVIHEGSVPEYLHPYLIQVKGGALTICYPSRLVHASFIIQDFEANLTVGSSYSNSSRSHVVTSFDDLSVTLELPGQITAPLVRGCPYITFIFNEPAFPTFATAHAVLDVKSNETCTKHKVSMNNGQTWLIFSSDPLLLAPNLVVTSEFKGVIRVALLNGDIEMEAILDRFCSTYPLEGCADISGPFRIAYEWRKNDEGELLMLGLPMHRELMSAPNAECIFSSVCYNSIDGEMQGIVGDLWVMNESPVPVEWFSLKGIQELSRRKELSDVLQHEIELLKPITTDSTYFHGKALARVARMAVIAEEIGCLDVMQTAREFLERSLTPWMEGSFAGNSFLYDPMWGGLISRNGSHNPGADFGLGVYNDHHYHMGYFCYACAVLAKVDPLWGSTYKAHLYAIAEDFMTTNHPHKQYNQAQHDTRVTQREPRFPRFRNFDFWVLHSWAGGLTEFADGRNQESTSEAVNAYYSASLLGRVFMDNSLTAAGLTLAAFEIRAARTLWHVPSTCCLYEPEFVSSNRMLGVLWANKRDTGLWFASPDWKECRLGIQLLPILPITEILFEDVEFVKELVEWVWPSLSRPDVKDGWKGFVYALQAIYAPDEALHNVDALMEHDDGNSLSNLLWWIYSR
ncbi:hypothetical protein GOP47_0014470 [Adiantum capillus-veneris]|uniref:glucan endo-1,3-beta-D-glucosidase n=1 Tax=Adiantum capillus-veneris TaxID=13818 RepID=A0A9D4ULV1_ADICA|nr:hypothetical protein GOP47_0014470 [Adiantum capillus-veneris]